MPPRAVCPEDLHITEWVELSGKGTLEIATTSAYTLTTGGGEDELVLGYVALAGASTRLLQQIRNFGDPSRLRPGLPVRAVWSEEGVEHPMQAFWFEPDD